MAEESSGDGWWGAWGTGFIENMKAKSAEAMSLVKNDLAEFVNVIQHDTTEVVADTASAVKDKLKVEEDEEASTTAVFRQGMSDWLGKLSSTLKENITQVTPVMTEHQPVLDEPLFDRMKARLHEIQTNPGTYCNEPDGPPSLYERWSEGFELDQHKGDVSELLVNKSEIRSLYTKLVPGAVTHSLFWNRYFYKLHQLQQEEKRRAALVLRADETQEDLPSWGDEEDDPWDSDDVSAAAIMGNTEVLVEKEKLGEMSTVSKIPSPSNTEQQQLQPLATENVTVKSGYENTDQLVETQVVSRAAVSADHTDLLSPELRQDADNRAKQTDNTDVSSKGSAEAFVDIAEGFSTTVSMGGQNIVDNTATKLEPVDSLKRALNVGEVSGKTEHAEVVQVLLEAETVLVEGKNKSNDKLVSGVTVGTESGVASGDGSCDPAPPVAVRSNSSDESVDSSWPKLGSGVAVGESCVASDDGTCDPAPPAAVRSNSSDESVDSSWSKLGSGVAVGESCVASGDGTCDPAPVRSNSSDESIDSSWSKLSDEANTKGVCGKASPSLSSSSSSAVVVSPVDDIQSLDWDNGNDDNDDLDLEADITEEEVKKMVEQLTSKGGDPDLDDDDWENWE